MNEIVAFASAIGWRGLEMRQHVMDDGFLCTWYETSDCKFFLQINEHPQGQTDTYAAAVYAERYGICTGFHCFALSNDINTEVSRLKPWLHRQQFKDPVSRRKFKKSHPECCFVRSKWPPVPPPYHEDDPRPSAQ